MKANKIRQPLNLKLVRSVGLDIKVTLSLFFFFIKTVLTRPAPNLASEQIKLDSFSFRKQKCITPIKNTESWKKK